MVLDLQRCVRHYLTYNYNSGILAPGFFFTQAGDVVREFIYYIY